MGKNKLSRWAELDSFNNVVQPPFEEVFRKDYHLKGKWNELFFRNNNPIALELGCGKGEYTVSLAQKFPDRNFLGIDIKGARMWKGAGIAVAEGLTNVGFLRTRIELIGSFFCEDEISGIWITFPDPQLKKRRNKKRLTGSKFLNIYNSFLKPGSLIHLKTDSRELYNYTNTLIEHNGLEVVAATDDLYSGGYSDEMLSIQTFYEELFMEQGKKITYTCFRLVPGKMISEPEKDE